MMLYDTVDKEDIVADVLAKLFLCGSDIPGIKFSQKKKRSWESRFEW